MLAPEQRALTVVLDACMSAEARIAAQPGMLLVQGSDMEPQGFMAQIERKGAERRDQADPRRNEACIPFVGSLAISGA